MTKIIKNGIVYGTAPSGLSELTDTNINNLASGNLLVYNGPTSKWINSNVGKSEVTSQITFTEDVSGTNTRFYTKVGVLYIFYQGESKTHSGGDILFTLPEGLRVTNTIYTSFVVNNTGYGNVVFTPSTGVVSINQIANGTTAGRIYFSCAIPLI